MEDLDIRRDINHQENKLLWFLIMFQETFNGIFSANDFLA